ncbi:glutamine--fructose-6-phosphate transaminase (isomerizing) [Acidianus sp. RZ1]|uniref:glutamine--fructose-6-phosphate transaminase (isomerizing) n=1 Tax=Acidianus sp. RZ1 TaxID=1540082 RepID=UPI001491AA22|nr:glutamine--fructose-6-phosphate transaminase (isomerizing) [Acidianus sp. RZ1]
MCGIIGIVTKRREGQTAEIAVECLDRLSYRGYDSVGVATLGDNLEVVKMKGKVEDFSHKFDVNSIRGKVILGHTRWATHGPPTDYNAHPHTDCSNSIAVVHNGTIENFRELKAELEMLGHKFKSQTDTEIIPHLIEEFKRRGMDSFSAFKATVNAIEGTYAILAVIRGDNRIYFAKKYNPLVIGIGEDTNYISSDIPSFLPYTKTIVVISDDEVGYLTADSPLNGGVYIEHKGEKIEVNDRIKIINWDAESASKEGYRHFMEKEIMESPRSVKETISGLLADIDEVMKAVKILKDSRRILIVGAGTSYHAGLLFSILLQREGINAIPVIASEYYNYRTSTDDSILAISQSGETLDVRLAMGKFKAEGSKIISLTNVIYSEISRQSDVSLYTSAGPEIGVAATKTFTSQVASLLLLWSAIKDEDFSYLRNAHIVVEDSLSLSGKASAFGEELAKQSNAYFLGRGLSLPLAMEAALKVKEIAYIHSEAYPAGESKHGPIALVTQGFPVIFINGEEDLGLQDNVQEMKARGSKTYSISINKSLNTDREILIKVNDKRLFPLAIAPLIQILAYRSAVIKGTDPDKPRNLAKTVTVR